MTPGRSLHLPPPAAALLRKTHAILDEHLTPHTPGGEGWRLGGGTVLAAHWKHRESFDLDIQVHPETERAHLDRKTNSELWRKLYAAGATHIDLEATPTVEFGTAGRIELIEARPTPRIGHERAVLDSGEATLLAPAQILTAKLVHRHLAPPVRDLYALAVAQRVDPTATAIAVNALSPYEASAAATQWTAGEDAYCTAARTELSGVPEVYRGIRDNPAREARNALRNARYRTLEVAVSEDRIVVFVESSSLVLQLVYDTTPEARTGFEKSGINLALRGLGISSGRVRNEANNALERGETRRVFSHHDDSTPGGAQPHGRISRDRVPERGSGWQR